MNYISTSNSGRTPLDDQSDRPLAVSSADFAEGRASVIMLRAMDKVAGLGSVEVRAAAASSLAGGGVRLYMATVREDGEGGWTEPWSWRTGVADPARRAAHLETFMSRNSPVMKIAEAAAKRWPWLGDDPPSGDGPEPGDDEIEIGRRMFNHGAGGWVESRSDRYYGPARALWAVEAMLGTVSARDAGRCEVRGVPCSRYLAEVRPGDAARCPRVELIDPPEADDDWVKLTVDVSIDAAGLIRRIMWSPTTGKRFKPGLLIQLVQRLEQQPPPDDVNKFDGRPWTVIEFWDYECPAQISAPTDLIDPKEPSLREMALNIWRMKRDYKRQHP